MTEEEAKQVYQAGFQEGRQSVFKELEKFIKENQGYSFTVTVTGTMGKP
jgi:hypothetical protein